MSPSGCVPLLPLSLLDDLLLPLKSQTRNATPPECRARWLAGKRRGLCLTRVNAHSSQMMALGSCAGRHEPVDNPHRSFPQCLTLRTPSSLCLDHLVPRIPCQRDRQSALCVKQGTAHHGYFQDLDEIERLHSSVLCVGLRVSGSISATEYIIG